MEAEKSNRLFEKYNPTSDITRCPYGKGPWRTLLDTYARAAMNLYGVIDRDELADIINSQNETQTTGEEIYRLLLPLIHKNAPYVFYQQYLVDASFLENFDEVTQLLVEQGQKPRYIPEKEEFLRFVDDDHRIGPQIQELYRFLKRLFGQVTQTPDFLFLLDRCIFGPISSLDVLMSVYDLNFSEKNLETFFQLMMDTKNNTRIWENKGHSPEELFHLMKQEDDHTPIVAKPKKIGRNDPCPCGSGKKYKRCCARTEDLKTAQLQQADAREFFHIWFSLISFINFFGPDAPEYDLEYSANSNLEIYKLRTLLWEHPELIDDYIKAADLPKEHVEILKLWKSNHIKNKFLVMRYEESYAVLLGSNEKAKDVLYGVVGISQPVSTVLLQKLPIMVDTVLLPFKGKIIYDSFMNPMSVTFGPGAQKMFQDQYDKVIQQGIITTLE